uniref:Signal recognition particle 19 kDa protein n=1 Tax=Compsopogon caeruleus TaxID=31354 RepID=A0A7S1TJ48_9RHOD|mmetsp:Transcript_6771/g.13814  ORF Transcript_6771/g.13814 Transcript_6771/m.13814 type:complete len:143 (+) Transcript_6771:53-481(+)
MAMTAGSCAQPVTKDEVDFSRWICIYPSFLDQSRSIQEGRRIPKSSAVDKPNCIEVFEAVKVLRLRTVLENKAYSRDFLTHGRIRVELFDGESRMPLNAEIPSRRVLFRRVAENIPAVRAKMASLRANAESSSKGKKGKCRK